MEIISNANLIVKDHDIHSKNTFSLNKNLDITNKSCSVKILDKYAKIKEINTSYETFWGEVTSIYISAICYDHVVDVKNIDNFVKNLISQGWILEYSNHNNA